jgi:DNA repair exonuclease SbcCD ATPase subunit
MLDALSFALFGKAHRNVSKQLLVNAVNGKGCVVSVTFDTAGHSFKIIRGIKPNMFEVWQNGSMIDQSSSVRDYQKFLEQNILKLNHKSFHQIVVLGSSSFIPFMQLSSNHRREVVEDLLDINIFSKMKGILKDRNNLTRNNAKEEKASLDVLKGKQEYQQKYVDKMESMNSIAAASNKEEVDGIRKEISDHITKGLGLSKKAKEYPNDLKDHLKSLVSSHIDLVVEKSKSSFLIDKMSEDYTFFDGNDTCPTCDQDISDEFKEGKLDEIKEAGIAEDKINKLSVSKISLNEIDQNATLHMINELKDVLVDMAVSQEFIQTLEGKITTLEDQSEVHDLTEPRKELHSLQVGADECRDSLDDYNGQLLYNEIAGEMLKDAGIRTKVIREYLPAMNTLINKYLQILDFFVAFTLDEHFNETIRSRHRDNFTYDNFSEGEKMRIDLSLLFTWRMIAKMKNSTNTNLLILDETFDSSLDVDGVDNLMKILHTLEDGTNTFIISHKPDVLESRLKSKIEFVKVNNFSKISC